MIDVTKHILPNVRTNKMKAIGVMLTISLVASARPCYNDVDTNLIELKDNLNVTLAVAGRFTIYPPSYYKKRIVIQSQILKKDPNNLDAYDNIAVAYDRIGDSTNALKWIREKRKHLSKAPKEHLYSTEANEGTILIVRWIRGHRPGDVSDAIESEKRIAKALEINPDAHFGREFAQLYSTRAMILCGKDPNWMKQFTPTLLHIANKNKVDHKKLRFGIAGMMVLGAAWKMPPLIQAIALLVPEDQQIAALCMTRLEMMEAEESGIKAKDYPIRIEEKPNPLERGVITQLLVNAEKFQDKRNSWIETKVAAGKHPDMSPDFWTGFVDVPPVPESEYVVKRKKNMLQSETGRYQLVVLLGGGSLIGAVIGYYIYRRRRLSRHGF